MVKSLVSIIIPCYNSEAWIAQAIQSSLNQTYPYKEIIVIDDGSTDTSLQIIKSFGDKVIWQTGKNQGGCAARNKGIALANGDFIQFLDADDLLEPSKIQRQMERLIGRSYTIATGPYKILGAKGKYLQQEEGHYQPLVVSSNPVDWLTKKLQTGSSWGTLVHCFLTPKEVIKLAGPWDESLKINQDGEFFSRVLLAAKSIEFVPEAVVYYRKHNQNSISRGRSLSHAESALKVCHLYKDKLLQVKDNLSARKALKQEYLRFIEIFYPRYPDLITQAVNEIHSLGFNKLGSCGGQRFQMLCRLIGFINALKIRNLVKSSIKN